MSLFFLAAGLLLVLAYLLFLPALRGQSADPSPDRARLSRLLYQQRREELAQELAQGNLDPAVHARLSQELDRQWLDDDTAGPSAAGTATAGRWPVLAVLLLLPLFGLGLYSQLGRPDLLGSQATPAESSAQVMEDNIRHLAERLQKTPDDLQGWILLARAYQVTQRPSEAQGAYEKALALAPDNLELKVLYAQSLAEAQGNRLQGRPAQLIAEVLAADPNFPHALWMAGLAAAEQGDAPTALAHWQKLKAQYPADSDDAKQLSGYIAMLTTGQQQPAAAAPALRIRVKATLAPALAGKVQPQATLFIFAKAAAGPPMPLAIVRKQAKDLPLAVELDDTMTMASGMNLAAFPQIILGARISKSGQAKPASGDLQGLSQPLAPQNGQEYAVEINQEVP